MAVRKILSPLVLRVRVVTPAVLVQSQKANLCLPGDPMEVGGPAGIGEGEDSHSSFFSNLMSKIMALFTLLLLGISTLSLRLV